MSLDVHGQAELLIAKADRLMEQGRNSEAAAAYQAAASEEAKAFDLIPLERSRTRGIVAVSSVALYRKAGMLEKAIRQAYALLAREDLADFARLDLEEMLDEMRAERKSKAG
jgi:hypothetical protein